MTDTPEDQVTTLIKNMSGYGAAMAAMYAGLTAGGVVPSESAERIVSNFMARMASYQAESQAVIVPMPTGKPAGRA